MKRCLSSWKKMIFEVFPSEYHKDIKSMSELRMRKLMDLMKDKITFPSDMLNHKYFFTTPDFDSKQLNSFLKKPKFSHFESLEVFKELKNRLGKLNDWTPLQVSKTCSMLLYDLSKKNKKIKNEDVFLLLRLAISGLS